MANIGLREVEGVEDCLERLSLPAANQRLVKRLGVEVISLGFSIVAWFRNNNLQSLLCRKAFEA
jgi:hypothetical protein